MDAASSIHIIEALANGIDPHTGEEYAADSPYQHPQTVRALFMAIEAMERSKELAKKAEDRQKQLPRNAGKAWPEEEDVRLALAFDSGKTVQQLAAEHERTDHSICARLVKLGKIK